MFAPTDVFVFADRRTFENRPRRYELHDIVKFINQCIQKDEYHGTGKIEKMNYKFPFWLRVYVTENLKRYPLLSWEKLECDHTTDRPTGNPTLEDLGVKLDTLEDKAMFTLDVFKRFGYIEETPGETPKPDPIKQYPLDMA